MTKQYPLIPLNGFLYAVDNEPAKYTGSRKHVFCTASPYDFGGLRKNCETGFCEMCRDVVASNDPALKELPILPNAEENSSIATLQQLMEELPVDWLGTGGLGSDPDGEGNKWIKKWDKAYKAASKKQFTEEDMRKAVSWGHYNEPTSEKKSNTFIQSLKPKPPIAVELQIGLTHADRAPNGFEEYLIVDENNFVNVLKWVYE